MKRLAISAMALIGFAIQAHSQTLTWQYYSTTPPVNTLTQDQLNRAFLNSDGTIYLAGSFIANGPDWRLEKISATGTLLWGANVTSPISGFTEDRITSWDVNTANGEVTLAGFVQNNTTLGDWRIAKFNSSGSQLWSQNFTGATPSPNASDIPLAIARDASNNFYVTGYLLNQYGATNNADWYTVKLSPSGTVLWSLSEAGTDTSGGTGDRPAAMRVATDGVYVTGNILSSAGGSAWRTVKYSPTGTRLWTINEPTSTTEYGTPVTMDVNAAGVFVTGYKILSSGVRVCKTVKYSTAGVKQWESTYSRGTWDQGSGLTFDGSGNIYVSGTSRLGAGDDWLVTKLNSAGTTQWSYILNGSSNSLDTLNGMTIAPDGNLVLVGSLQESGFYQAWRIQKLTPAGAVMWNASVSYPISNSDNRPTSFRLDGSGNIYVTGFVQSFTNFDWETHKYSPTGTNLWTITSNGSASNSNDRAKGIILDPANPNTIYIWGDEDRTGQWTDFAIKKYTNP